jgi:signal transduction histidine kinase
LDYAQEYLRAHAFDHLGVGVAQLTLDGNLLTANNQFCRDVDRPPVEILQGNFKDIFYSKESWAEFDAGLARLVAGEIDHYSTDLSVKRENTQIVWLNVLFSLASEDITQAPHSLIAVANDITALKRELHDVVAARDDLSKRMTNAQDADRKRIARELHDDIGQSLAVLKIQMLRAGQPVSDRPEQTHASLRDLVGSLEIITQKVGRISHGLHSPELEFLGLTVAIQAQCRQFSTQLRIPVHCSCDEIREKLDDIVGLTFLRVVQEALHNIGKHSHAKDVTVRVGGSDLDLTLEIIDDGVGFDIERSKLAAGLGLISMRERMHLIGGDFDIWSAPGHGTRIKAHAPIVKKNRS